MHKNVKNLLEIKDNVKLNLTIITKFPILLLYQKHLK